MRCHSAGSGLAIQRAGLRMLEAATAEEAADLDPGLQVLHPLLTLLELRTGRHHLRRHRAGDQVTGNTTMATTGLAEDLVASRRCLAVSAARVEAFLLHAQVVDRHCVSLSSSTCLTCPGHPEL